MTYLIVLVSLSLVERLGTLDIQENMRKRSDSISVTPHHQVSETNVVISGNLARWHSRIQSLKRIGEFYL